MNFDSPSIDIVLKLGGSLLSHSRLLDTVLSTIQELARQRRLLVVPGGGPFADVVRGVDRQAKLSDDAAHWMAVLAMDQYGHLLASRLPNGVLLADPGHIQEVLDLGHVPVLAPYVWLRQADPLPHTWDVTSDSIAAWVAGTVGARRLVLVKPPGASPDAVDPQFRSTLPDRVHALVLPADQIHRLRVLLG